MSRYRGHVLREVVVAPMYRISFNVLIQFANDGADWSGTQSLPHEAMVNRLGLPVVGRRMVGVIPLTAYSRPRQCHTDMGPVATRVLGSPNDCQ